MSIVAHETSSRIKHVLKKDKRLVTFCLVLCTDKGHYGSLCFSHVNNVDSRDTET